MTVRDRLRRAPLVAKLTTIYALVAVLLFAAVGGIIFLRFESELNRTIDADLRSRGQALATIVDRQGPAALQGETALRLLRPQGAFAQVLDRRTGRVLASTRALRHVAVLSPQQAADVQRSAMLTRKNLAGVAKRARFALARLTDPADSVLVVGRSLKDREGANESFARALLIGGPLALLLASAAAYALARAALRPVESMRRRAASISVADPHARLPVSSADDEISRLGHTLNDMLARLEHAFDQQRELTANASHELRTPLSILISRLEIALRRPRSEAELRGVLEETLVEARRLDGLADDLLLLARLDAGQDDLEWEQVDLHDLVADVEAALGDRLAASGRTLVLPDPGVMIAGDRARLEHAVSNLVGNALTHGAGAITVAVGTHAGTARIAVRDEGPGIPAEFADDAFARFARHPTARSRPGAGLGLALVQAVARAHGGCAGIGPGPAEVWIEIPQR